jgi:hypothetical protein
VLEPRETSPKNGVKNELSTPIISKTKYINTIAQVEQLAIIKILISLFFGTLLIVNK